MKLRMPVLSNTQALQVGIVLASAICWADTSVNDDYGIASLYLLPIILTRWYGNAWTAAAIIAFSTLAEVYTNVYVGAYAKALARGHGHAVIATGVLLHIVGYTAVTLTIRWILQLLEREREVTQKLFKIMQDIRELESLLPICSYCKKIRDDAGQWEKLETYIADRTGAHFTHGVCPDCRSRELAEFKATHKS